MLVCAKQELASKPDNTRNAADNLEREANFIEFLPFLSLSRSFASAYERRSLRSDHGWPNAGFCSVAFFIVYEFHQNEDKEGRPGNAKDLENQDSHCLVLFYVDPISEDDSQGP
jgi:hypothetical protein